MFSIEDQKTIAEKMKAVIEDRCRVEGEFRFDFGE